MKVHIQKFFGGMYISVDEKPTAQRAQGVFFPGDLVHPKSWRRYTDLSLSSPDRERQLHMRPGEVGVVLEVNLDASDKKCVRLLVSGGVGDCYLDDVEITEEQ